MMICTNCESKRLKITVLAVIEGTQSPISLTESTLDVTAVSCLECGHHMFLKTLDRQVLDKFAETFISLFVNGGIENAGQGT